jgi:hypothetical protein
VEVLGQRLARRRFDHDDHLAGAGVQLAKLDLGTAGFVPGYPDVALVRDVVGSGFVEVVAHGSVPSF